MIQRTFTIVGPGGVGKSPLDALFKTNITRIDPYRLRSRGPRDSNDIFYAHPRLHLELDRVFRGLGDEPKKLDNIKWCPKSKVLFFKVRDEWQFLILNGLEGDIAKAEIYAPVLPTLLSIPDIRNIFGMIQIVVLNPANQSVTKMQDWKQLEEKTRNNCIKRSDPSASVQKRVSSVAEEAPAWKKLIEDYGATEYCSWQFPEYLYKKPIPAVSMVEHQKQILLKAHQYFLGGNPDLEVFFKIEDEIKRITEPFVK